MSFAAFSVACTHWPAPSMHSPEAWVQGMPQHAPPALLLLGEQHDAPEHQQWQLATVHALLQRQQLAAVVIEMAEQGHSTQHLPPQAAEAEVQQALQWNHNGWPWSAYGPAIMSSVRAGIPVIGGNLPRIQMLEVMQQPQWDQHLPASAWQRQQEAIRTGHCGLLPETQITPMARIQLAKDARMAQTAQSVLQPQKTVVLIAGRGHVARSTGIPTWLLPSVNVYIAIAQAGATSVVPVQEADAFIQTPDVLPRDHCKALQHQWQPPAAAKPT